MEETMYGRLTSRLCKALRRLLRWNRTFNSVCWYGEGEDKVEDKEAALGIGEM